MKKNTKKIILGMLILGVVWGIGSTTYEKITGKKIESVSNSSYTDDKTKSDKKQNETKPTDLKLEDYIKQIDGLEIKDITNSINNNGYLLVKIKHTTDKKSHLAHSCYRLLKSLKDHKDFKKVDKVGIMIMAEFRDKYGNIEDQKSFSADFKRSELDKINWDNFSFKNILNIGEDTWYHPSIKLDE